MKSFEKLFANSTNRLSAVRNIILSQSTPEIAPFLSTQCINENIQFRNSSVKKPCNRQQISQTYQQLQLRYEEISKTIKQANHEKQLMTMLFDKLFKIQQGEEDKLKKRFRRKKNQIQAKYECKIGSCNKIYTSSTSLARHSKLKHPYSMLQPPQHNYQIPPSPNLQSNNQASSQLQKREDNQSNTKPNIVNQEKENCSNVEDSQERFSIEGMESREGMESSYEMESQSGQEVGEEEKVAG